MRGSDEAKPDLTERQLQIVALIARGCSNDEVGEHLGISPRTAKAHCDVLRQKLGVPRRRQIPAAFKALTDLVVRAPARDQRNDLELALGQVGLCLVAAFHGRGR